MAHACLLAHPRPDSVKKPTPFQHFQLAFSLTALCWDDVPPQAPIRSQ